MTDNWLRVIPAEPAFVPPLERVEAVAQALAAIAPDAQRIEEVRSERIEFIDAGSNFESVTCPSCGSKLEQSWWCDRMSDAFNNGFTDLHVRSPCCHVRTSLNDLEYDWPQGFARWRIELLNPNRGQLDDTEVEAVRLALGAPVRIIWTHV